MQPPLEQTVGKTGNTCFSSMSAEIITEIFCQLPSFADVFALETTCTRFRYVWTTNVTPIYGRVAQRSIPCERHAHSFLADQGGPPLDGVLSAGDVVRMVRNTRVVENAILQFEREIVCRVKANGFSAKKYYGVGARRHPPNLTRTERLRFIRSYYQLWGIMKIDATEWPPRLEAMTLKQLYYLYEMTKLTQSIGMEEIVPAPPFPNADPDSVIAINSGQSKERIVLGEKIWGHIERAYQRIYHKDAEYPWILAKDEGFLWFIVMWDHWQPSLKQILCGRRPIDSAFEKQYLWDDSSDEEI